MIYCTTHNTKGRLGNGVMRLMSLIGLSEKHNTPYAIPTWKYAKYFENEIRQQDNVKPDEVFKEPHYHYAGEEIAKLDFNKTVDFNGFFQSPKYWTQKLKFTESFMIHCDAKLQTNNRGQKREIAISIRRGDFINNGAYAQLGPLYYIGALLTHFPDWKDSILVFFSDDIAYCKVHFECLPNAVFAEGMTDIEQLCRMSQCTDFIISNSTFSYCGAYLCCWANPRVVRPKQNFSDEFHARGYSEKDYWPEHWTIFDHTNYKLDLKDTTFTIPVKYDHNDRKKNLDLSLCLLQRDFDSNFIVGEQGGEQFKYIGRYAKYIKYPYEKFHRTKMLNEMAKEAETPFIVNWDADMICPPLQLYLAVDRLRNGVDMVYPYDGSFARMPREKWFRQIEKHLDIGVVGDTKFNGKAGGPMPTSSVGGAILFNKQSFIQGGMENEYMISYAPEDCERYDRFNMLGFRVDRITGTIYHMDHFIGPDSTSRQPLFKKNKEELEKIRNMNQQQLWEYVSTWPWLGDYNGAYYEAISPESIRSAKKVYAYLKLLGIEPKSIVDVGCGVGHWGKEFGGEYWGLDSGVPKHKLLIKPERYVDFDLRKIGNQPYYVAGYMVDLPRPADLVLCLEVAEHLPEDKADDLVKLLCQRGDRILFSAAIPYQGGKGHINEQFQTYWAEKFKANGFGPAKQQLRELIKGDEDICVWYRQNMVIYEKGGTGTITDYVHPQMWMNHKQTVV